MSVLEVIEQELPADEAARRPVVGEPNVLELTDDQRVAFLKIVEADRKIGNVAAMIEAGIEGSKRDLRATLQADEDLLEASRVARGFGRNQIRAAIVQRGIEGIEEDVYNKDGEVVGTKTVYSDRLLDLAARMWLPEGRALTGRVEVTGAGGGPIQFEDRSASLADTARVLIEVGAINIAELHAAANGSGDAQPEVADATPVLAEPSAG